ncbi:TnsD family Tn7-like transposition protein [Cupriavidus metallidurans]|nr:TnsD family Tn7-like transposition protein [Cupriavidus metallidurans]
MEALLRKHLVALLKAGHFEDRPEHPNFREAAARAGFGPTVKIDYTELYEAFSEYWGDVLERLDERYRTRPAGVSWLHAQFNARGLMGQPVVRELFDIFFRDRCGLDVYQMPPLESSYKRFMPVFYCPNPYAAHGRGEQVKRVTRCKDNPDILDISCKCGFTAMVSAASAGKTMTMADVIKVGKFGPTWPEQCAKLRAEGKGLSQVAKELNLPENTARYLWRQSKPLLAADEKTLKKQESAK